MPSDACCTCRVSALARPLVCGVTGDARIAFDLLPLGARDFGALVPGPRGACMFEYVALRKVRVPSASLGFPSAAAVGPSAACVKSRSSGFYRVEPTSAHTSLERTPGRRRQGLPTTLLLGLCTCSSAARLAPVLVDVGLCAFLMLRWRRTWGCGGQQDCL